MDFVRRIFTSFLCSLIALRQKERQEKVPQGVRLDETSQILTRLRYEKSTEVSGAYTAFIHLLISSSLSFFLRLSFSLSVTYSHNHTLHHCLLPLALRLFQHLLMLLVRLLPVHHLAVMNVRCQSKVLKMSSLLISTSPHQQSHMTLTCNTFK